MCFCISVQDCDRWGEERSLASHCGECIQSHEARGTGEGAEHVQRRGFISVTVPAAQSRAEEYNFQCSCTEYSLLFLAVCTTQGVPQQPRWTGL